MSITYVEPKLYRRVPITGNDGRDEMGYGRKIKTGLEVFLSGRWYKVYATCISNVASAWILQNKKKLHLHDTFMDAAEEVKA